jgi:hypothetical protein
MPKLVTAEHTKLNSLLVPVALSLLLIACGSEANTASSTSASPPVQAPALTTHTWTSGKPSIKELMDAAGIPFLEASHILYGSIGSNADSRDWNAIMNTGTDNIVATAKQATAQMYGGYRIVTTSSGNGYTSYIISGTGILLTSAGRATTAEAARAQASASFANMGFYSLNAQGQPVISNASGSGTTSITISNDIDLSYQPPVPEPTPPPTASLSKTSDALEGNNLTFTLTLDAAANGITTAQISYGVPNPLPSGTIAATGASTCTGTADYTNSTTSVNIASGQTSATFTVPTCVNATTVQASSVKVSLSSISGNAQLSSTASNLTQDAIIYNNSVSGKLNDTGSLLYGTASTAGTQKNNLEVTHADAIANTPAQQDAAHGRDAQALAATLAKVGASSQNASKNNGFDFTKISSTGQPLSANALSWDCVLDNNTGLMWENKTDDDNSLRGKNHTYTWYNSTETNNNGGNAGTANGGACPGRTRCDTEKYVSDVNTAGLCGYTNWRMPTVEELQGIADIGRTPPAIDTTYFLTTDNSPDSVRRYWSSSAYANFIPNNSNGAWLIGFFYGDDNYHSKHNTYAVRLVRSQ